MLSTDETQTLLTAQRWLSVYCNAIKEPSTAVIPEPTGTTHEAWLTLKMVLLLWGFADTAPGPLVRAQVPTPWDFTARINALLRRLEGGGI